MAWPTRALKASSRGGKARVDYHAYYHMNVATPPRLAAFKARVGQAMARFA